MRSYLLKNDASFAFRIKIADDKAMHDINDPTHSWTAKSAEGPDWVTMGRLTIFRQTLDNEGVAPALNLPNSKVLSFNIGHTLHPPVGDINFFRQYLYPQYDALLQGGEVLGKATQAWTDFNFASLEGGGRIEGGFPMLCPFAAVWAEMQARRREQMGPRVAAVGGGQAAFLQLPGAPQYQCMNC